MSNGSKTHSTFRPVRNGSTEYTLPSTETVPVLRTCRITLQENASLSSAGSGTAGGPGGRRLPGLGVRPGVVDRPQPGPEQLIQLLQVRDRVPGRLPLVPGDLDHELLLDRLEHALDLAAAHRASRLAVGQPDAEHRARPLQRRVGKGRPVVHAMPISA